MKTTRRQMVTTAAAGTVAGAFSAPAIAQSRPNVRWRLPSSWPPRLLLQSAPEIFARRVSELTDGAFEVRVYPAGELVPPLEILDSVKAGTVECGHSWGGYLIGRRNAFAIDGGLPFGMNASQHTAWWMKGGGREAMQPLYDEAGVINFLCGDTGAQMGGWFNQEVNSVEDLQGMRLRIAGLAGRLYTELGASTQLIPGGEILTAMERGVIDGVQFNTPYDDLQLGLQDVSKYYYHPCPQHPAAPLSLYVNRAAYEELPKEYQAALEAAVTATHVEHIAHSQNEDTKAYAAIVEGGAPFEVRRFPEDVIQALSAANDSIMEEFSDEDPEFSRIYPGWKAFLDEIRQYHFMSRYSFDSFIHG